MASASIIPHPGARLVHREELDSIATPAPTSTWFPLPHSLVFETARMALESSGFEATRAQIVLVRHDARMFVTFDLASELALGVTLAAGIQNSLDKSFALGFTAGHRVLGCDNLAFRSDVLVAKKQTRLGRKRFEAEILRAVSALSTFQKHEAARILELRKRDVSNEFAESLLLRAYEARFVSDRILPKVIAEWRKPSFDEFEPRTAWSLLNAFSSALGDRAKSNPPEFCRMTMEIGGLVDRALDLEVFALPALADADIA